MYPNQEHVSGQRALDAAERRHKPVRQIMKLFFKELAYLFLQILLGASIFTALFSLGVLSHSLSVLMYRGLALAFIAAVMHIVVCALATSRLGQGGSEQSEISRLVAGAALAFAVNTTFLVVFPVTIDRSVTVYLLGQIAQSSVGLTEAEMRDKLIRQYVEEYGAVQRRMQEQLKSGNVISEGGTYRLSPQGDNLIKFSKYVASIFGADPKYIGGVSPQLPGEADD